MAKWREPARELPPDRLFHPFEWPSVDEWRVAALEWLDAGPGRSLPFGQHGDAVDVIRESARLKLAGG